MSMPRQRYLDHPASRPRTRVDPLSPQGATPSAGASGAIVPTIKPVNGWILTEIPENFGLNYSRLLTAKVSAVASDAGDYLLGDTVAFAESHGTEVRETGGRSWVALKASNIVAVLDAVERASETTAIAAQPEPEPAPAPEPATPSAPAKPDAPTKPEPVKEPKSNPSSDTKEKPAK